MNVRAVLILPNGLELTLTSYFSLNERKDRRVVFSVVVPIKEILLDPIPG